MRKHKSLLPEKFTDKDFDLLFPPKIQHLSSRHWTPISVIKQAIDFLYRDENTKILDIGSGSGKFCLVGGMQVNCQIFGVEKRNSLIKASKKVAKELGLDQQVDFIHSSVEDLDLRQYDSFYFFNSFHENLDTIDAIEKDSTVDEEAYHRYTKYLKDQLEILPKGTRLATYCSDSEEVPSDYLQKASLAKGKLIFWEKQ